MVPALLVLEDGCQFNGIALGALGTAVGEVVFNTAMSGYQEILTDPSYCGQIVTLTMPHIGNTGVNNADSESSRVHVQGLVIRSLSPIVSSYRSEEVLDDYLKRHNIVAISDIDTRQLTHILREKGAQKGCIMSGAHIDPVLALGKARAFSGLEGLDLAKTVTTPQRYLWHKGHALLGQEGAQPLLPPFAYHVVVYDFGVKQTILKMLVDRGCSITVVPATTTAEQVLELNPEGIVLSNGPGDPAACTYAITAIKQLLKQQLPILGICLGHQLLALAGGGTTVKMRFGHHGANHPVQDLHYNKVMITAQNHGFAVDEATLPKLFRVTHRSLFDGSLQGFKHSHQPVFGFQGHPEASPGPHDGAALFDDFIASMQRDSSPSSSNH